MFLWLKIQRSSLPFRFRSIVWSFISLKMPREESSWTDVGWITYADPVQPPASEAAASTQLSEQPVQVQVGTAASTQLPEQPVQVPQVNVGTAPTELRPVPPRPTPSATVYAESDLLRWSEWIVTCVRHTGKEGDGRHAASVRPDGLAVGAPMSPSTLGACLHHLPPAIALPNVVASNFRLSWTLVDNEWCVAARRPSRELRGRRH